MRNFLNLLYRYHNILLFLFLEGLALFLIIQNNSFQRSKYIEFSTNFSGGIFKQVSSLKQYFSLNKTNFDLAQENIELRNRLALVRKQAKENRETVIDTIYKQRYVYFSAQVVNNSVNKLYNYITLNKGSKDGVKLDMAVITHKGIVGFVNGVSDNFSTVIPVINRDFRVAGKFKSNGFWGSVAWQGFNPEVCDFNEVPHHVNVQKGDTIITVGSSSFPEGIPIGTVKELEFKGGNFYSIKIKLANDFRAINYVILVDDLMKKEQRSLEKQLKHD
jgi:rod shape-determining protein MreC